VFGEWIKDNLLYDVTFVSLVLNDDFVSLHFNRCHFCVYIFVYLSIRTLMLQAFSNMALSLSLFDHDQVDSDFGHIIVDSVVVDAHFVLHKHQIPFSGKVHPHLRLYQFH